MTEVTAAIAATLTYVADTLAAANPSSSDARWLRETAQIVTQDPPDWTCCPVCEEVICDSGCPVMPVRRDYWRANPLGADGGIAWPAA